MAAFRDSAEARQVIGGFFEQEAANASDNLFAGTGVIIAYTLHNPELRVVLDASKAPEPGKMFGVYLDDPNAPEPKVDIAMDADTFDGLFRGELHPMQVMMTGKAKAKGDVTIAMRLLPAMARAVQNYKKYRQ